MPNAFNRLASLAVKQLGDPCSAIVSGSVLTFNGIYKAQNLIKTEDAVDLLLDEEVVIVETTVANQLAYDQSITVNGSNYLVGQKRKQDDGSMTVINLKGVTA